MLVPRKMPMWKYFKFEKNCSVSNGKTQSLFQVYFIPEFKKHKECHLIRGKIWLAFATNNSMPFLLAFAQAFPSSGRRFCNNRRRYRCGALMLQLLVPMTFRVAKQYGIPHLRWKTKPTMKPTVLISTRSICGMPSVKKIDGRREVQFNIKTHKCFGGRCKELYMNEDESHPDYKNTDVIISLSF